MDISVTLSGKVVDASMGHEGEMVLAISQPDSTSSSKLYFDCNTGKAYLSTGRFGGDYNVTVPMANKLKSFCFGK